MSFTSSLAQPMAFFGFASGSRKTSVTQPATGSGSATASGELRALRRAASRERGASRRGRDIAGDVAAATRELSLLRIGLPH